MTSGKAKVFGYLMLLGLGLAATHCASAPTERALSPSGQVVNGVRVVIVDAKRFEFIPNRIVIRAGERVRIKATSLDVPHGFAVDDFGVNRRLTPGKTETIEFTANQTGTFPFYCNVYCGLGHGNMRGEIMVLPSGR